METKYNLVDLESSGFKRRPDNMGAIVVRSESQNSSPRIVPPVGSIQSCESRYKVDSSIVLHLQHNTCSHQHTFMIEESQHVAVIISRAWRDHAMYMGPKDVYI
jgi:hypothetical protein